MLNGEKRLATDRIGYRLAAVDKVLSSIAPQTPMNIHSELKLDALRNILPMELGVKQMSSHGRTK